MKHYAFCMEQLSKLGWVYTIFLSTEPDGAPCPERIRFPLAYVVVSVEAEHICAALNKFVDENA